MVKLHFLLNHWSDVNHNWQLWSLDDCLPNLCVLWPVKILFGCHGNIKFKNKMIFLNDNSSKTTVSSVENFITAYQESIKPRLPFFICSEFFVSKGYLFDIYYISLPCAVNMYKIMILLNNSLETTQPKHFHQISHWTICWNEIESLFKWSCSIDCHAHIFLLKISSCFNDGPFISCNDKIGKMLHNICISAVAMSLRWASCSPWASCLKMPILKYPILVRKPQKE